MFDSSILNVLAKNLTKKAFPKITDLITGIFPNNAALGNRTMDHIEASGNIILLTTMQSISDYSKAIKQYQPILVGVSVTILSVTMMLLFT